jgi:hypothetical protein
LFRQEILDQLQKSGDLTAVVANASSNPGTDFLTIEHNEFVDSDKEEGNSIIVSISTKLLLDLKGHFLYLGLLFTKMIYFR